MWMLVFAAIDVASLLAVTIGVVGLAGVVFTALKFRRDDTTAVVDQQWKITQEMRSLSEEQRIALVALREERDNLRSEVDRLTGQVEALTTQLEEWTRHG